MKKKVIIIGAGPAGLTAAYEILKKSNDFDVTILEKSNTFGGISKTVNYQGNYMDMGGHRFFSKIDRVNEIWEEMLPLQGKEINPEKCDNVFLYRNRVSRIYFNGKFFDYPITISYNTIKNMGLATTTKVIFSYMSSKIKGLPEDNLENLYINRFGKKLYNMFFKNYTTNVWGRHPNEIDASWGKQRAKGLSILSVLKDSLKIGDKVETSLIKQFKYPKFGPGQLWEHMAEVVKDKGAKIIKEANVVEIHKDNNNISSITYEKNGKNKILKGDFIISSMPLKDLINDMNGVPKNIKSIAKKLPYRDYMTLGVLVKKLGKNFISKNQDNKLIPDCWVYVHDANVKMCRFQIYNNWSPYLVKDNKNTIWLGLEYYVNKDDKYWKMSEKEFSKYCIKEMLKLGLIDSEEDIIKTHLEKVEKAYPAYFDTYDKIDELIKYLNGINNLYCVGRNGQHRYNNMDHSMATAIEAVKNIKSGKKSKENIWSVNTENEYHETKK